MNCKQGDLAIIIRSYAKNEGKLVTCLRLATLQEQDTANFYNEYLEPAWLVDRKLNSLSVSGNAMLPPINIALDSSLRPIRESDGEDQILLIAGKPGEKENKQTDDRPKQTESIK